MLIKASKAKENFANNQFHNILRLVDVLPNFLFSTSGMMGEYYSQTWDIRVASRIAKQLKA